jgi:hypothetical protein
MIRHGVKNNVREFNLSEVKVRQVFLLREKSRETIVANATIIKSRSGCYDIREDQFIIYIK